MKIGYARVSTNNQDTQLQIDALTAAGCERIYEEKQSGAKKDRAEFQRLLMSLREGDVLIVLSLDRLGRRLEPLIDILADLEKRKIGFQSLTEAIDTTSHTGKLNLYTLLSKVEVKSSSMEKIEKPMLILWIILFIAIFVGLGASIGFLFGRSGIAFLGQLFVR